MVRSPMIPLVLVLWPQSDTNSPKKELKGSKNCCPSRAGAHLITNSRKLSKEPQKPPKPQPSSTPRRRQPDEFKEKLIINMKLITYTCIVILINYSESMSAELHYLVILDNQDRPILFKSYNKSDDDLNIQLHCYASLDFLEEKLQVRAQEYLGKIYTIYNQLGEYSIHAFYTATRIKILAIFK